MGSRQSRVQLVVAVSAHGHQLPLPFHQAHKMAVAGIARIRHQHTVTRVHQQRGDQQQGAGCAWCDHDARGRDIQTIGVRIVTGQGLTQLGNTRGLGIIGGTSGKGRSSRLDNGFRRGKIRFPGGHMHDIRTLGRQLRGPGQHLHHPEWFYFGHTLREALRPAFGVTGSQHELHPIPASATF